MKRLTLTVLLTSLVLAPAASARGPLNRVIHLGQSAGGVSLLDSRATVVRKLGRPYYENTNGYMQYLPDFANGIFDVYRLNGKKTSSVRLISVADTRFRLADGTNVFAAGGLRKLQRKVGSRLKRVKEETGELSYTLTSTFRGRKTFTNFGTPKITSTSRVAQIFIGLT